MMGLTTFNRMRRAMATRQVEEKQQLETEEATNRETERLNGEQEQHGDGSQNQQDFFTSEFHGSQPTSKQIASEQQEGASAPSETSFHKLRAMAKELNIEGYGKMSKEQLQEAIVATSMVNEG